MIKTRTILVYGISTTDLYKRPVCIKLTSIHLHRQSFNEVRIFFIKTKSISVSWTNSINVYIISQWLKLLHGVSISLTLNISETSSAPNDQGSIGPHPRDIQGVSPRDASESST